MESLRRTFGIAEPVRRGMELKIAGAGEWRPQVLGGASSVHSDILAGRDCEIGWEDVFVGKCGLVPLLVLVILEGLGRLCGRGGRADIGLCCFGSLEKG